jgi:FkbM family methyltransferase
LNWKVLAKKVLKPLTGTPPPPPKDDLGRYLILGRWMYVDDRDSLGLTNNGIFEPEDTRFIQNSITQDYVTVDIGANIGYYTLIMAGLAKEVHAFEPEAANYGLLLKNLASNNITNVTTYNKAVSDTTGKKQLFMCDFNRGMHRLYPSHYCKESVEVETVRLDEVIRHADFIKMDIEGAELGALKGMTKLLEKGPKLMMEFHPPSIREYGADPKEVVLFMESFGYRVMLPDREVTYQDLERVATEKPGTNVLCVAK